MLTVTVTAAADPAAAAAAGLVDNVIDAGWLLLGGSGGERERGREAGEREGEAGEAGLPPPRPATETKC